MTAAEEVMRGAPIPEQTTRRSDVRPTVLESSSSRFDERFAVGSLIRLPTMQELGRAVCFGAPPAPDLISLGILLVCMANANFHDTVLPWLIRLTRQALWNPTPLLSRPFIGLRELP